MTENTRENKPERPDIDYPCIWIYKVIGEDYSLLKDLIVTTCSPIDVKISHSHTSSKGKYHSLNAEVVVPDEARRLEIYEQLQNNPAVKIVL